MITQMTSEALDKLTGAYFSLNRSFDRCVSIMANKWAMPNASNIIHTNLAHLFPILADKVTEIKDRYNLPTVYLETHKDDRDYEDLGDMWSTMLKEVLDVVVIIELVNRIATEQGDFNVCADLINIMQCHNIIVGQVSTLKDKAEQISYDDFDAHINLWGIDGIKNVN